MIHADFRKSGCVSLWLGDIDSETAMDDYLSAKFAEDFGFEIDVRDSPESSTEKAPVPIGSLLDGFSRSKLFKRSAVAAARRAGWGKANAAVVFYNFCYDPRAVRVNEEAPLKFIGVFPF